MTALAMQIIEPHGNLVRLGPEAASQLQRKAAAQVLYVRGGGQTVMIPANVPAIPWSAGAGFGAGANAPTAAATVDITTYAGRWVTFLVVAAGGTFVAGQMYVCQVTDWPAIAGPAGGRTVIPLDLWELHSGRSCGPEFTGEQALPNSGRYTAGGGVAVAASTDVTTQGDYGTQHISFPTAYGAGLVPAVTVTAEDAAFVASVQAIGNTGFDVTVRRVRSLREPVAGELDLIIPPLSNAVDGLVPFGVTYDQAPVVHVEVVDDPSGADAESSYQASQHDRGLTNFWAVIFHMPHPSPLTSATGSATTGGPTPNLSGTNATLTTGMSDPSVVTGAGGAVGTSINGAGANHSHTENTAATYAQNATTATNSNTHTHTAASHTHVTGDHTHSMNNHSHDLGAHTHTGGAHTHTVDVFPNEAAGRTLRVGWTAFGRQHADATTVPLSWMARG